MKRSLQTAEGGKGDAQAGGGDTGDRADRGGFGAVPSLIKWTGSKRRLAAAILPHFPPHRRYFEPFLGGGSLLFHSARPDSVAGDLYGPLVELWRAVQEQPAAVRAHYRREWETLQRVGPPHFYVVRERFNQAPNALDLCFLMRTCVNGIVRFNREGAFNNSFHLSRPGMHPDRFDRLVERWTPRLQGVRFVHGDYEETLADAGPDDLVYLDPPYAGSTQRYIADLDIERFLGLLEDLNRRGTRWVLSFDGGRGDADLTHPIPPSLYRRHLALAGGHSALGKVLNGPLEEVRESLYLNFG